MELLARRIDQHAQSDGGILPPVMRPGRLSQAQIAQTHNNHKEVTKMTVAKLRDIIKLYFMARKWGYSRHNAIVFCVRVYKRAIAE